MKLSLLLSIPNQRNLNVHDQDNFLFANIIFTKTSVKCTDCLTLWKLYVWNSNTATFHCFLKLKMLSSCSCNKYFPLMFMNYLWSFFHVELWSQQYESVQKRLGLDVEEVLHGWEKPKCECRYWQYYSSSDLHLFVLETKCLCCIRCKTLWVIIPFLLLTDSRWFLCTDVAVWSSKMQQNSMPYTLPCLWVCAEWKYWRCFSSKLCPCAGKVMQFLQFDLHLLSPVYSAK